MKNEGLQPIVLGVDFGATKIQVGAITPSGKAVEAKRYATNRGSQQESVDSLQNAVASFLEGWDGEYPSAIGVGLVGHIDRDNGVWIHSLNAKISEPVEIAALLSARFGVPVFIDNDVHCATLAEAYFGVGRVSRHFILINVGTGVGCGIVEDGRLLRGVSNSAGEFGHTSVETGGELCPCGYFGCLEGIVGGAALIRSATAMLPSYPDSVLNGLYKSGQLHSDSIFEAAHMGDPLANKITQRAVKALGIGIVNLANLLNPEHIVLAGSVLRNEWFVGQVKKFVYDNALIVTLNCIKGITPSFMNVSNVGMYGAACLCFDQAGRVEAARVNPAP